MATETEAFLAEVLPGAARRRAGHPQRRRRAQAGAVVARDPVTLYGAGCSVSGWTDVEPTFRTVASWFSDSREYGFEVVAAGASGDLAYTVGYERNKVHVDGQPTRLHAARHPRVPARGRGTGASPHRHADLPPGAHTDVLLRARSRTPARWLRQYRSGGRAMWCQNASLTPEFARRGGDGTAIATHTAANDAPSLGAHARDRGHRRLRAGRPRDSARARDDPVGRRCVIAHGSPGGSTLGRASACSAGADAPGHDGIDGCAGGLGRDQRVKPVVRALTGAARRAVDGAGLHPTRRSLGLRAAIPVLLVRRGQPPDGEFDHHRGARWVLANAAPAVARGARSQPDEPLQRGQSHRLDGDAEPARPGTVSPGQRARLRYRREDRRARPGRDREAGRIGRLGRPPRVADDRFRGERGSGSRAPR